MKLPPPDVDASARGMIKNFGGQAKGEAELRAAQYAAKSDKEGRDTWLAIAAAIGALSGQMEAPKSIPYRLSEARSVARGDNAYQIRRNG